MLNSTDNFRFLNHKINQTLIEYLRLTNVTTSAFFPNPQNSRKQGFVARRSRGKASFREGILVGKKPWSIDQYYVLISIMFHLSLDIASILGGQLAKHIICGLFITMVLIFFLSLPSLTRPFLSCSIAL